MIEFPYQSYINADEILTLSGINLTERLLDDDFQSAEIRVNAYLREIAGMVYDLIVECSGMSYANEIYQSTNDAIIKILKVCQYYQACYIFYNGNMQDHNGLLDNGTFIDINELRGTRNYDKRVITYLTESHVLYNGIC